MPHTVRRPVFFDPSSRRWQHVLRVTAVLTTIALVLMGSLAIAVLTDPGLPKLSLEVAKDYGRRASAPRYTVAAREARFQQARKALEEHLKTSLPPLPATPHGKFERIAFFVNWDDNSWVSLKRNVGQIDTLV